MSALTVESFKHQSTAKWYSGQVLVLCSVASTKQVLGGSQKALQRNRMAPPPGGAVGRALSDENWLNVRME